MKYIKKIFCLELFIFFIFIIFSIYSYSHIFSHNLFSNYSYSELFINYQAGFVRRGLLGELFWQIYENFKLDPKIFFGLIFYSLYLFQIYFLYVICKSYKSSIIFLLFIVFAPQLILFPIYDYKVFFLKDIFSKFMIFFHGYLILKCNKSQYLKLFKFLLLPLLTISILIHEYQILFLGIHILISINFFKTNSEIKKILKYYLILAIPVLLIFFNLGNNEQFNKLNEILIIFNAEIHPQLSGGFKHLIGGFYKWHFYYFSYNDFVNFLISIILSIFIPILIFVNLVESKVFILSHNLKKNYFYFFFPTLICFLALDHGRNISLIANHIFIFYLTLNINKKNFLNIQKKIQGNITYVFLIILLLIFYIFMWKLDQYAGFALQGKDTSVLKSSLFAEITKFIKYTYYLIDLYYFDLPEIKL